MHVFSRAVTVSALATRLVRAATFAQDSEPTIEWRVQCTGNGKTLACRETQGVVRRADKPFIALRPHRSAEAARSELTCLPRLAGRSSPAPEAVVSRPQTPFAPPRPDRLAPGTW